MDRRIFGNTRLLLSSIVFILLFFSYSCVKNKNKYIVTFNITDENNIPLEDIFVTAYRLVDDLGNKERISLKLNKFGLKEVDSIVPSLKVHTIESYSDCYPFFKNIIENYQIENLKKCFDNYFLISKHYGYYFDWKKSETMNQYEIEELCYMYKNKYELEIPYDISLELLEKLPNSEDYKMVPYKVPIKYYLVFRKIGYGMQSVIVGPRDKSKTITIKLHKKSSNPHLETIHKTIRKVAKTRWNTSESSTKKLKKIVSKLQQEQEYAEKNGYIEDAINLKQYIFSIPIDNVRYVVVGENKPPNNEKMFEYISMAEKILEQDKIDITYFDRLIRKMSVECIHHIPYDKEGRIESRLKSIFIKYFEYLEENRIIYPIFPDNHYELIRKLCGNKNAMGDDTEKALRLLKLISRQSLEINPFQSRAWDAYEVSQKTLDNSGDRIIPGTQY